MASNTLKTRIRSKIDYLANWNNKSEFIPLLGEICIAIIPRNIQGTSTNVASGENYIGYGVSDVENPNDPKLYKRENSPNQNTGNSQNPNIGVLTPYAIGIKVGDGVSNFSNLPWVQALAGDVYAWAKEATPPSASNISVTYNNQNSNVQTAISGIETSLGGLVTGSIDASSLGAALATLTNQLSGASGTRFDSNYTIPTQENETPSALPATLLVRKIEQDGLNIAITGSAITANDIPNLTMSKISDLATTSDYNFNSNPLTTRDFVRAEIASRIGAGALSFLGIVYESDLPENTKIEDGTTNVNPIIRTDANTTKTITNLQSGNVILYREKIITIDPETSEEIITDADVGKEFLWTGTAWELLGDEGSYAVKGSITNSDIAANANIEQSKISGTGNNATLVDDLNNKVDKEAGKGLSTNDYTNDEKGKLAGIENNAEENIIESIKVNGTAQTITNKEVDITIPVLKMQPKAGGTATNKEPDSSDHSITFAAIAFDGSTNNLVQGAGDYLILDCGDADQKLYDIT